MNIRYILYFTGKIMRTVALLFLFPSLIAIIYGEYWNLVAFLPVGAGVFVGGWLLSLKQPNNKQLNAKEGFIIVALSWILIALVTAVSYKITGEIGSFIDCFFEAVSGYTTTGASVVSDVEGLSYSVNALRLFTHWVGGMGILVLVLAIAPKDLNATSMNIFRAEVPGHQVEKFTTKITLTAKILYLVYTGMTVILFVCFVIAKMPVFDSIVHAMSIAGTGGFSVKNASLGAYGSVAIEIIATVFMILFGVNLNIFYFILIGKFKTAIKSEEFRVYIILLAVTILVISIVLTVDNTYENFGDSLRYSSFQIASIISTTGMYVVDFSKWAIFGQSIVFALMFVGGCAGSTAGGIKLSRIMIAGKYVKNQVGAAARPNRVRTIRLEGERLDRNTVNGAMSYIGLYLGLIMASFIVMALFDNITGMNDDFTAFEKLTSIISAVDNCGPAFGRLATGTYADFSVISKLILCFDMLAGRLEILPMLFLFNPLLWSNKN